MKIDQIMRSAPVIPVLVLDGSLDPEALARALVEAGLPVIEVTLRTPDALVQMKRMAEVPGAIVGAGTVLNPHHLDAALDHGAQFIVSPGLTDPLAKAAIAKGVPFLPGVASAGDIMRGLDHGLDRFKFFPAEAAGGLPALKALAGPFGDIRFCPTGGIREETAASWLSEEAVLCVGGSWILPKGDSDLAKIGERARAAAGLKGE
ncbi:bifunctional 4-hydroxy-2-oxoglutarate aldolase/2-dehydro-3-deoxy-phosphogluconate aldolase [Sphingomicrobium lutaoense]|uniref:2-dehydro-3-deoxy-phosphogluconate aldolase n=1 Tax=Sphingomicrobium lutaoense TaxID=515949 RepID=A0A839YVV4_9SPHN|nr:bifunctional 4-hydroxy-2-oxoglutarate aldolase/2-dehydro-3-deoxy-phosphogluconate aldolase [Sphingomicrobium lutaoense]MBB3763156.1 2-dehydro-3-deoxyphosphogluconate aldolase/(4S)-4-hydroxy-2-oxoglutarate aldolase [Sphingomicrobium lutaoense]